MKEDKKYFYSLKTKQLREIRDEHYEPRLNNFKSVQSTKKILAQRLWINKDSKFKISKKKEKYIVEADKVYYSPFANNRFAIRGLEVEFKNIFINSKDIYDDIKIVTNDERNEIINQKLYNLSSGIINGQKSFHSAKVEKFKKLTIGNKVSLLDGEFNVKIAILRTSENEFELLRAFKNKKCALILNTESADALLYKDHPNIDYATMSKPMIENTINSAIELIEDQYSNRK